MAIITINQQKLEPILREQFKAERQKKVDAIKVTVDGMEFNGNEISQDRMTRAIVALADDQTIVWVLADNTPVQVNKLQLTQALQLAGAAQAAIWVQ